MNLTDFQFIYLKVQFAYMILGVMGIGLLVLIYFKMGDK